MNHSGFYIVVYYGVVQYYDGNSCMSDFIRLFALYVVGALTASAVEHKRVLRPTTDGYWGSLLIAYKCRLDNSSFGFILIGSKLILLKEGCT